MKTHIKRNRIWNEWKKNMTIESKDNKKEKKKQEVE